MLTIYNILLPESCISLSAKRIKKTALSGEGYLLYNINYSQLGPSKLPVNQNWHREKYGFNLSESEIEIFLLHRLAWQYFLQSENDYCVIAEGNDLVLENIIPNLDTLNLTRDDWDVLFPFSEKDVLETKDALERRRLKNYNSRERREYESYLLGRKWGSFIYFLTRKGMEKLLQIKEITQNWKFR